MMPTVPGRIDLPSLTSAPKAAGQPLAIHRFIEHTPPCISGFPTLTALTNHSYIVTLFYRWDCIPLYSNPYNQCRHHLIGFVLKTELQ